MRLRDLLDWDLDRFTTFIAQKLASFGMRTVWLAAPLTSTSWDGDAYSTTAKTKIDLSAVFSAPAGIRAVYVVCLVRDSDSRGSDTYLVLSPNDTADSGPRFQPSDYVNDRYGRTNGWVPCDSAGDIYYQVAASGAGTFDVIIQIWGYQF
jgi:hypothetical protein